MATADPGSSGLVSFFEVTNKLQNRMDSFREVIEKKKLEVRRVSKEMRSLIEKKEEAIIRELNTIWEEISARMGKKKTETQKVIRELEIRKKEIDQLLQMINQTETEFPELSKAIEKAIREMDIDIPNVKLTWRIDEFKDCIDRMCRCEQKILVYNQDTRYQLKWGNCKFGSGDNQLYDPWGIATNPMNDNVFVADSCNNRVQIFTREGEWIRSVKDDEIKNPKYILFYNQTIYVQCSRAILKLNEFTERKEKSKSYDFYLGGICTDNIHIYVSQSHRMNLLVLTLDLIEESIISLKTQFCKQNTQIRDISLSQELFYVLLHNSEFPIQVFSIEGILTRCVVSKDSINCAICFCLDQQHNILIADQGDAMVKIFSNEGKLLTQLDGKCSENGQFFALTGISLSELGDIVTVQLRNSNLLKQYSHL